MLNHNHEKILPDWQDLSPRVLLPRWFLGYDVPWLHPWIHFLVLSWCLTPSLKLPFKSVFCPIIIIPSVNTVPSFFFFSFFFGCAGSSLLHAGFLYLWRAGATLRCGAWASHCDGFSWCGAQALGMRASVVAARGLSSCGLWALEHRLSSCGARA